MTHPEGGNTPQKNNKGESSEVPASSEKDPTRGFKVEVEDIDGIFQAAKAGKSGLLGRILLEQPINWATVSLTSNEKGFRISAKIETNSYDEFIDSPKAGKRKDTIDTIFSGITNKYPDSKERNEDYFLLGEKGTSFVIFAKNSYSGVEFSTRDKAKEGNYETDKESLMAPLEDPREMNSALKDLDKLLKTSVKHIYSLVDKETPDETLVLRPPEEKQTEKVLFRRETATRMQTGRQDEITPDELLGKLEIETPNVSFDEVGGHEEAITAIKELKFAIEDPESYREDGITPPRGIILYGPPGTGKTLMVKALATQTDAKFFNVNLSDIVSKWYGQSEKILSNIFTLANQSKKRTIIFFDEIDAIAPKREEIGAAGVNRRTVSTLLSKIDGMEKNENITVIAATNHFHNVDPALLRAGRLDIWINVDLPDNEGRKQIFDIHIKKIQDKIDKYAKEKRGMQGKKMFDDDLNFEDIVKQTEGLSGADIAEIVRRAVAARNRQRRITGMEPPPVSTGNILKQIKGYEKTKKAKESIDREDHSFYF